MLYQPLPRTRIFYRALGLVAGWLAGLVQSRQDGAYLEGLRDSELEDLGLRRDSDQRYRPFE